GLARTFQINALFRRLSVIENITLAISEREGLASDFFRPAGHYRAVTEEAYALLESLGLADEALRPVNELAYGRQRLAEIAVSLAPGATLALLGRDRVAQTTLLAPIMGLTTLHGGSIRFRGADLAGMPPYDRCRCGIGFVPQEREIFPSLTLEENIIVAAR